MAQYIETGAFWDNFNDELEMGITDAAEAVNNALDNTKIVDVAPVVHAHWESEDDDEHWCSHCNSMIEDSTALEFTEWGSQYICLDEEDSPLDFVHWKADELPPYCPHCGAKMDEEEGR